MRGVTVSDSKNLKDRSVNLLRLWSLLFVPLVLASCNVSLAKQSAQSPQANQSSSDAFLGTWKFNPDKNPDVVGLESKSVVVESQGSAYKLTIDDILDNGVKSYFSANTSMKAEVVKTFDKDGKEKKQEWRVTRNGPDSFTLEWLGLFGRQQRYQVAADGKTMTIRDVTAKPTIIGIRRDKNGNIVPGPLTVLDRDVSVGAK
jgi:hypothetical protein